MLSYVAPSWVPLPLLFGFFTRFRFANKAWLVLVMVSTLGLVVDQLMMTPVAFESLFGSPAKATLAVRVDGFENEQ